MKFTEFNLHPDIQKGIDDAGFVECTPVQELTFKSAFNGSDILAQSQTGTGKTAAFLISLFQIFTTEQLKTKKALILVPTRELAVQIETEAKLLGKYLNYKIGSFFGGVGYGKQDLMLQDGVDVYIATPGRLIDYVKGNKIKLNEISAVIIDEADRMFDMGFIPDIRFILKKMPDTEKRLTMLFSATLSGRVRTLAWEYMNNPAEIEIAPESVTIDIIEQSLYHVGTHEKMNMLLGILKKFQPKNVIIFANTKNKVEEISVRLKHNGFENEFIIGDLPQKKRQKIIDGIKAGNINCLIATDVAARGLHVDDLDLVINFDLPEDCENYVHRIGRTARAGKEGRAISLACERYVYNLEAIETYIGKKIPIAHADDDLFAEDLSKDLRFSRHDGGKGARSQKKPREHERKSQSNKFSKQINASHSSYDKPSVKKHKVITDAVEPKEKTHQHAEAIVERNRRKNVKPVKNGSVEQRMEYYRLKYGETFKPSTDLVLAEYNRKRKGGIVKKLLRALRIIK